MNKLRAIIILTLTFITAMSCYSVESSDFNSDTTAVKRPVLSTYSLEWGATSILDSYLSPLKYEGQHLGISGSWFKAMRQNPDRLIMSFEATLTAASAKSPARNSILYEMGFNFAWTMQHRWNPINGLQLSAGGGAMLNIGGLYLSRNSNNPASARASVDIIASGMATYNFKIGKLPVRISDRLTLPIVGAFFSPDYGETYYEIYLGNHSDLVHCGWWGNHFCIDNMIAADLSLGNVALRIGYHFNLKSSYVNNINTRLTSHGLVVGLTSDWLNITNSKTDNQIVPAIY